MGNKERNLKCYKKLEMHLVSVSDKSKLSALLSTLSKYNIKIISSGGTYKAIKKLGYKCARGIIIYWF